MGKKYKVIFLVLFLLSLCIATFAYLQNIQVAVLDPKGIIADKQKYLFIVATLLMLIVVIPVFVLAISFAWKYRESNKKAKFTPDWDKHIPSEIVWWGLPFAIIIVLGVITWQSSHELDPFKPIESDKKPLTIQVVALQWKWLFIYPEQGIATLNLVQFPEKTPINFEITSDAPMNSFWIPQLGGQIYAMPGMRSKLHLMAHAVGSYRGSSANLSGKGFAGMVFTAKSSTDEDFEKWVREVKSSNENLTLATYDKLVMPSENNPVTYYDLKEGDLYNLIVMKYVGTTNP